MAETVEDWLVVQESAVSRECAINVDLVVVSRGMFFRTLRLPKPLFQIVASSACFTMNIARS